MPQLTKSHLEDYELYARDFLRIIDKDSKLVPFVFNRAQKVVWRMIAEDMAAGLPVRQYWLKARQLGFSTFAQGFQFWRCALNKYQQGLTVAHDSESSETLHLKAKVFYGSLPQDARPDRQRSNRKELLFAKDDPNGKDVGMQSRMVVQTADNKHLGASLTLRIVHLSEFARFEEIQQNADLAYDTLMQTVPEREGTFVFIETTAFGTGFGKRHWDDEDSGYRKVFISWCASDEYRMPEPMAAADLDDAEDGKYGNEIRVLKDVLRELSFWYPDEARDAGWLRHEALCRMAWRRHKMSRSFGAKKEKSGKTKLSLFRQEYPTNATEAFLTSGSNVFDTEKLHNMRQALREDGKLVVLPAVHEYDSVATTYHPSRFGPLRVYEAPEEGKRYVMGADSAEGVVEGDESAVQVLRLPDLKLAATFQALVPPDLFAEQVAALGRMYNYAFAAVEINGPGYAVVSRLTRELAYPALYWRETFDDQARRYVKKFGWNTNKATKPLMISDLRRVVRVNSVTITDDETLEQMGFYVEDTKGRMGAVQGENDDLVMALALALQMATQQGAQLQRSSVAPVEVQRAEPPSGDSAGAAFRQMGQVEQWLHVEEFHREKLLEEAA